VGVGQLQVALGAGAGRGQGSPAFGAAEEKDVSEFLGCQHGTSNDVGCGKMTCPIWNVRYANAKSNTYGTAFLETSAGFVAWAMQNCRDAHGKQAGRCGGIAWRRTSGRRRGRQAVPLPPGNRKRLWK